MKITIVLFLKIYIIYIKDKWRLSFIGGINMNEIMFKINDVACRLCLMFIFEVAEVRILNCNKALAIMLGFVLVFVNMCIIHITIQITKRIIQKVICLLFGKINNDY